MKLARIDMIQHRETVITEMIHWEFTQSGALLLIAALLLLSPLSADADIYKYVDKHGRVTLTDRRPANVEYKRLVKTWKGWHEQSGRIATQDFAKNQKRFTPTIDYYAEHHNISIPLLHAVISAESAYDPNAVSRAGAVGLMQLMPETARRYGVNNRQNPTDNIKAGSRHLKELLEKFDNDIVLALAAYNAGENAVIRNGNKVPPYQETRSYIKKVFEYYRKYQETMAL